MKTAGLLVIALAAVRSLDAQTCDSACNQFIASTNSAINSLMNTTAGPTHPLVLSGSLFYANGSGVDTMPQSFLLDYVDGLKAAGVQRVDLNPGVTSLNDPVATALYDAVVQHIRELGMQLAINPEIDIDDRAAFSSFLDFQSMAMTTYPALAKRYQPDNFVIVHEPTTQDARLGVTPSAKDWDNFVRTLAPLIQAASPHTRVGAGGFYSSQEDVFFRDFVALPTCPASNLGAACLDFMTVDIYSDTSFTQLNGWVQMAHQSGKGIYVEETWAPKDLPSSLPAGWQALPGGLDSVALVGTCDIAFAEMDVNWLNALALWASVNGMEAITPFTTSAFFFYGSTHDDDVDTDATYIAELQQAVQAGQSLTAAGQAYLGLSSQYGIKESVSVSSASYATLPSVFNPNCGSPDNPCNARTVVAPDELVSAFGADLANTTRMDGGFPTILGGTTMTLVDSSNTTYQVPLFFVAPGQVNYYVPNNVKTGPATVTIKSGDGTTTSGVVLISQVMPGIYTASSNGQGAPAAIAVIQHSDGSRSSQLTYSCSGSTCSPASINLASGDDLVIEFYGTGIRHASSLAGVSATANGKNAPVQYAGASAYSGEDQVNIQIPSSVFHSGTVDLMITVDGQTSNTVTLDLP